MQDFFAPPVGFEPTTLWLTARRSTTELRRNVVVPTGLEPVIFSL